MEVQIREKIVLVNVEKIPCLLGKGGCERGS